MALRTLVQKHYYPPTFTCCLKPAFESKNMPQNLLQSTNISRRVGAIASLASLILARESIYSRDAANAFDFRMTTPDQTIEEAEDGIRGHVESLLEVKDYLESESWRDAQRALRQSSSKLKQDLYTIIQNKPGKERPQLRKLFSDLFNNVTRLDYAARDKDASLVRQYYENIASVLDDILSRI
ncbi:hypothetical protein Tsubulata_023396 [Turnera subulata]|uniref:PQL-like protein n=1 Tax=Turnera subulata TaxID=218843 RepID=A0A9Q0F8H7_9ROSI|nr:hypothetical protein Tsubulata_023396 [Turnera subulata]